MSLRSIFLLIVGMFALLAALVTGAMAVQSWSRYDRASRIVAQDALLAEAAAAWARERGVMAMALTARDSGADPLAAVAVAGRASSDASFHQAMRSLAGNRPSLFMTALLNQAEAAHARLAAVRAEVDAALRLPVARRSPELLEIWLATMADLNERNQLLRLVSGREAQIADPVLGDLQMLRHFAWTVAEHAGRERAIVGALISGGEPIDPPMVQRLATNRGKIEEAWQMVRFYAGTSSAPDHVRMEVRGASDRFFSNFELRRKSVIAAGTSGGAYGITGAAWFQESTNAIDSLLAVEQAAGRAATAQLDRSFTDTVEKTLLEGLLFLGGVGLAAGLFLLLSRRIIEPIKRMTAAMTRLARGDIDAPIPDLRGGDEIGDMAAAMRVFREDAVARRRLEAELRTARDQAEAANRIKTEFLATMSHELRTPLNAIIGFSEMMQMQALGPIGQPQYLDYVNDIHDSGSHLLEIINNILDMARIEVGRLQLEESEVAVGEVIDSCRAAIEREASRARLTLSFDSGHRSTFIRVDARKLRQALMNLLSNAVKFTPAGGRVDCRVARSPAEDLVIEIADTGIGMSAAEIEVALEPFRQVDGKLSRRHEGTGLGLALSRGLAELHGGRIELSSAPAKGTRARLILPRERLRAVAEPAFLGAGIATG